MRARTYQNAEKVRQRYRKVKAETKAEVNEVPLILWTPLRHNQPKEVSDECTATEVHSRI